MSNTVNYLFKAQMAEQGHDGYFLTEAEKAYLPMVRAQHKIMQEASQNNLDRLYRDLKRRLYDASSYDPGPTPERIKDALDSFFQWVDRSENRPYLLSLVLDLLHEKQKGAAQVFPFDRLTDETIHFVLDLIQVQFAIQVDSWQ